MDITPRLAPIKLLLMDVDGVLTNGRLYNVPDPEGKMVETKAFDSQDGIALQWMNWNGIRTGLISGRVSPATVERATQTKFTYIYQGHIEKIPILEEILADAKIDASEVAYIGDDLTDEDGFRMAQALGGKGVIVGARRPTAARFALADCAAALAWIEAALPPG